MIKGEVSFDVLDCFFDYIHTSIHFPDCCIVVNPCLIQIGCETAIDASSWRDAFLYAKEEVLLCCTPSVSFIFTSDAFC